MVKDLRENVFPEEEGRFIRFDSKGRSRGVQVIKGVRRAGAQGPGGEGETT